MDFEIEISLWRAAKLTYGNTKCDCKSYCKSYTVNLDIYSSNSQFHQWRIKLRDSVRNAMSGVKSESSLSYELLIYSGLSRPSMEKLQQHGKKLHTN